MTAAPDPWTDAVGDLETTVLVVEDDLSLRALYARSFESSALSVLTAAGLLDARSILRSKTPSAVLLDIGLEDDSGLQLLAELPEETIVVVVTGKRGKDLVREVLAAGADDVLFKPFPIEELTSRVLGRLEARDRRASDAPAGAAVCLTVDLDNGRMFCRRRGEARQLSQREIRTLKLLLDGRGEIVSRETISRRLSDEAWDPGSRRVDALLSRLRRKLACERCGIERALTTVHGRGYRFAEPERLRVREVS